ncbi:hypothetical protein DFH28DRAFT_1052730 [Melampsora americana]|nr:hypothetical protein DFH28DRAFT_1052730 [Melampsora americana]
MFTSSKNELIHQSSSTQLNLELTQSHELKRGSTSEEVDVVSSDSANANVSSPTEANLRLRLDINEAEDPYASVISRINQWRESTSKNLENPTYENESNDQIPEMIEERSSSREETKAEIELREKLKLLQDLLNETDQNLKDDLNDSEEEEENENYDRFNFLIGEPDFKDILFLRCLWRCSPFDLNGGISKSFSKCAHLLRTSESTKEYFASLSINSGPRLLKERFLFLKSWITTKPRWNLINAFSKAEDEEIHQLIRDLLDQKITHSTHKQSINTDQCSVLSGSSYGSVSSYETFFESESSV